MGEIDHREGRAALFGEMHQRLRLDLADQLGDGAGIAEVHLPPLDLAAGQSLPELDSLRHAADRHQAPGAAFTIPAPANQAVEANNVVAGGREMEGGRPAEVTVHPQHDDPCTLHGSTRDATRRR